MQSWSTTPSNSPIQPRPEPETQMSPGFTMPATLYPDQCSPCPSLIGPSGLTSTDSKTDSTTCQNMSPPCAPCSADVTCTPRTADYAYFPPPERESYGETRPQPLPPPPSIASPAPSAGCPCPLPPPPCKMPNQGEPQPPYMGPPSPAWYQMQRCLPNTTSPAMHASLVPCGRAGNERFFSIYQKDFCRLLPCGGWDIAPVKPAVGSERVPLGVSVGQRREYVGKCGGGTGMHGGAGGGPQKRPRRVYGIMGPPPPRYTFGRSEYQAKVSRLGGALLKFESRRQCGGPCRPAGGRCRPPCAPCPPCRPCKTCPCPPSVPSPCCRPPCKPCPCCRPGRPCRACRPPRR